MKIILSAYACFDSEANATQIRVNVGACENYVGDQTGRTLHDAHQEILWDDTHAIALQCSLQKAISRWSEAIGFATDPF